MAVGGRWPLLRMGERVCLPQGDPGQQESRVNRARGCGQAWSLMAGPSRGMGAGEGGLHGRKKGRV